MATKPKVGPPGSTTSSQLPEMKNNMVSLPTLTSYTTYWKYVAPKTGYVIFDALLSTTANQEQTATEPAVQLSGPPTYLILEVDEFGERVTARQSRVCYVTKGQTYTVTLQPVSAGPVNLVLRISDFHTERDVEVPDLTFVNSQGSQSADYQTYAHASEVTINAPLYNGKGDISVGWANDAAGHGLVDKALGGIAPGEQIAAIECAWQRAKKMSGSVFDSFYWGANPDGATLDDRVRWQGLSICQLPYKPSGGAGYTGSWSSPLGGSVGGSAAANISYDYSSYGDSGFALSYGTSQFYINHVTARVDFESGRRGMEDEGLRWLQTTVENGLNGTGYIAEAGTEKVPGNVVGFAYAADESDAGNDNANTYGPMSGLIFAAVGLEGNAAGNTDTWTDADWMSVNFPLTPGETSRWWPITLEGTRRKNHDPRLPIATWKGGYMDYVVVPRDVIEQAKGRKGLWLSMIPNGSADPTPFASPSLLLTYHQTNTYGHSLGYGRFNQALVTKWTAEYPHFHVIDFPAYPDSTMLGIGGGPKNFDSYFVGRR